MYRHERPQFIRPGPVNRLWAQALIMKASSFFYSGQYCFAALGWFAALNLAAAGCGTLGPSEPEWPADSKRWYDRASSSYEALDNEDARNAVSKALQVEPSRAESRLLAARIALAQLDYTAAVEFVNGLAGVEASSLRARAYWYGGKVAEAGVELESLLADPGVKDKWADEVLKLTRTGAGREPFAKRGSLLAVMEMPRTENAAAMLVPVELNGQPVLAMLSTNIGEVVVDSSTGREPSWVSLVFDGRVEVKDVPAVAQDLSGISRAANAPIKVLLGTNVLRHLNATFDVKGRQFVVRNYEPPPPPLATQVPVAYIRGGGMVTRSKIGPGADAAGYSLFVDSTAAFALALDDDAWKRTGVDPSKFAPVGGSVGLKQGNLDEVRLGSLGVSGVPAVSGRAMTEWEQSLGVNLDGMLGAGLLANFRVTIAEGGRTLWFEELPKEEAVGPAEAAPEPDAQPLASPGASG